MNDESRAARSVGRILLAISLAAVRRVRRVAAAIAHERRRCGAARCRRLVAGRVVRALDRERLIEGAAAAAGRAPLIGLVARDRHRCTARLHRTDRRPLIGPKSVGRSSRAARRRLAYPPAPSRSAMIMTDSALPGALLHEIVARAHDEGERLTVE